ncbi:MAG: peptidoglycan-associated lipoprotein, partial [Sulfurospirillum sp.]|nr:peptidoglycan-associated lipoprotein [Sulfurospirillum sp.]
MNKIALTGLAVAMLILSGCSQKNPEVDMQQQQQQVSTADKKAADISGMDANNMDSGDVQSAVAKKIAGLEEKSSVIYFDFDKYNIRPDMQ